MQTSVCNTMLISYSIRPCIERFITCQGVCSSLLGVNQNLFRPESSSGCVRLICPLPADITWGHQRLSDLAPYLWPLTPDSLVGDGHRKILQMSVRIPGI